MGGRRHNSRSIKKQRRNMKRKKKVNISYIAGLFDGEGCITTSQIMKYNYQMKKRYKCTTIRAEISNTDFGLIDDCYKFFGKIGHICHICLLYTSPSPRDGLLSRMPSSA